MRILPTLLILALSAISINSYADAQTIVSIKKITTISGADADRFKKLFDEPSTPVDIYNF